MPIAKYDIFFSGAIMEGRDQNEVRNKIGALFKADAAQLERLFSGTPVKIKSEVDMETAIKYRVNFREAGALIDIKPATAHAQEVTKPTADTSADGSEAVSPPPATKAAETPPTTETLTALPPKTGSLIDCAPHIRPAELPDISGISLSETGTTLDDTPPPPDAKFDTSDLSVTPAGTGSLEDCQLIKEPVEIPDISGLTASEPGTGTLEDCYQEKKPVEIPDISAMKIIAPEEEG